MHTARKVHPSILVVEDETVVSMDVCRRLDRLGYGEALTARTGEDALDICRSRRPDLVLMDIVLEGEMDGIEAAAKITEEMTIPVIYLTAHSAEEFLDRAKITDPFGYILKPFEDRELTICIEMALSRHAMRRQLLENERRLATTLKSISDAVITTDAQGMIAYANPAALDILCAHEEDLLGRRFPEVARIVDAMSGEALPDPVGMVLQRSKGFRLPGEALLRGGCAAERPVDVTASEVHDEHGERTGVVLVLRDVTESKRAEEALRQSVRDLRRTLEEAVAALAITSEKRDPYTAGHQQRVAQLAYAIAVDMDFSDDSLEGIRVASLLHDLGKIYIPAEILAKPAALTAMEMGMMKTHSEVGYDILKRVSFPWPVAEMVLQHHERLDGSGYPQGLMGHDILPEAKIISVADVVEAMSSHRPYRAALGLERALGQITKFKGDHFDPEVVDTCLKLFKEGFRFE